MSEFKKPNKTVKNLKIRCDQCGHEFKLKPSRVKLEKVTNDGLDRTYFKCPNCKHKYIVMYKNNELKDNLAKMAKLIEETQTIEEREKNLVEYDKLYKRNLEISKGYKEIYGC